MVRAEVEVLLRPDVVDGRHPELGMRGGDAIERPPQVGVLLPDHGDRVLPVPPYHVAVQVGHDAGERYRGVLREVLAAPQPLLLAAHGHEDEGALGWGGSRQKGCGASVTGRVPGPAAAAPVPVEAPPTAPEGGVPGPPAPLSA